MPFSKDQLDQFIIAHHESQETSFRYALYAADLSGKFEDDEDWDALCSRMAELDDEHGISDDFVEKYQAARDPFRKLEYDLYDNYLLAAFAARRLGMIRPELPLIAYAAFNKNQYQGLPGGEFALVRLLAWMGCDVNAPADNGRTALHLFASMNPAPYSNPRAVEWLLARGADADVVDKNGDTPLIYMACSVRWTNELSDTFVELVVGGEAELWAKSADGSSALSLFIEHDQKAPNEQRQQIIEQMREWEREAASSQSSSPRNLAL